MVETTENENPVHVPLYNGGNALVDAADFERPIVYVHQRRIFTLRICDHGWRQSTHTRWHYAYKLFYRERRQHKVSMHRLIIGATPGQITDHINGDTLDNRRANLQICTTSQNAQKMKDRGGVSRFRGVVYHKPTGLWMAQIGHEMKRFYLGYFKTEEDAALAYNVKAKFLFGDFARLNDVSIPSSQS
jgi:hypothetical protein